MPIRTNANKLIAKMVARQEAMEPSSEATRRALHRIGTTVVNRAKLKVVQERIIDQGALLNSLRYEISGNRVTIGSFGVRYARFHEYGAQLPPRAVRAMFASMRARSGPKRAGKGVLTFNSSGGATMKARPFLAPAFEAERARILAIINEYSRKEA